MQYYAIKHLPSGKYLPPARGRGGRGGTHVDPVDASVMAPRLFHREQDAKTALNHWLRGEINVEAYRDPLTGDYDENWSVTSRPERMREEMAIVMVNLVLA